MFNLFNWFKKKWKSQSVCAFNPRPECLQVIEDKPCIPGEYECYQKSRDASKCLKEHGYDAYAVCGPVKGLIKHHCWVEIKHEGEIYWYDPTWINRNIKYGCWPKSCWSDRTVFKPYNTGKIKYSVKESK